MLAPYFVTAVVPGFFASNTVLLDCRGHVTTAISLALSVFGYAQRKCARVPRPNSLVRILGAIHAGNEYGASTLDYYSLVPRPTQKGGLGSCLYQNCSVNCQSHGATLS